MRYLVRARVRPGMHAPLERAIAAGTLGRGSIAGGEYLRNMRKARVGGGDGLVKWVEICYCPTPLAEERPYWEAYFELVRVQDAHHRRHCSDANGADPFACESCDCTERLERKLAEHGEPFLARLRQRS